MIVGDGTTGDFVAVEIFVGVALIITDVALCSGFSVGVLLGFCVV